MSLVYIMSRGRYWNGSGEWVWSKSAGFEFTRRYGQAYALQRAIEIAQGLRRNPLPHKQGDANPVQFLT